jgi:hypothetical protein
MVETRGALPRLDFETVSVSFPERGGHAVLCLPDLSQLRDSPPTDPRQAVWLFRARSGLCGLIPGAVRVLRDSTRVAGLAILRHGDHLDIAGTRAQFFELRKIRITAESRLLGRRCPCCHEPLEVDAVVCRCPLCGEAYCQDCWSELHHKQCFSRGCRFSPGPFVEPAP